MTVKPLPEPQYRLHQFLNAYRLEEAMEDLEPDEKVMIWLSQSLVDRLWTGAEGP